MNKLNLFKSTLYTIDYKSDFSQALKLYHEKNYHAAITICKFILLNKPNDIDTLHLFGVNLNEVKNYEFATLFLNKAISINPHIAEIYLNIGVSFYNLNQLIKAVKSYDQAIILKPDLAEA